MNALSHIPTHGPLPPEPSLAAAAYWYSPPIISLLVVAGLVLWFLGVRRVQQQHPQNPVPRSRSVSIVGAAVFLLIALQSVIERYDTTIFSVHMVQHLILLFPVPILLLRAAPVTLVLRLASPRWRARILALLQSRLIGVISHPIVAWLLLVFVMWATHLSPLFDAALDNPLLHHLEHLLYLSSALLFWAPVFSLDPVRHRLSRPAALFYLITQMPQNSFLGVAIMWAPRALYPHYETLQRGWGPTPLEDQQLAGSIMWLVGDALFLLAVFAVLAAWMRAEERPASRYNSKKLARELAEIRRREAVHSERTRGGVK
ncbi:MAG: cytochrome c oxidase assembly protein [Candidatus Limnocylindrus sp.]